MQQEVVNHTILIAIFETYAVFVNTVQAVLIHIPATSSTVFVFHKKTLNKCGHTKECIHSLLSLTNLTSGCASNIALISVVPDLGTPPMKMSGISLLYSQALWSGPRTYFSCVYIACEGSSTSVRQSMLRRKRMAAKQSRRKPQMTVLLGPPRFRRKDMTFEERQRLEVSGRHVGDGGKERQGWKEGISETREKMS